MTIVIILQPYERYKGALGWVRVKRFDFPRGFVEEGSALIGTKHYTLKWKSGMGLSVLTYYHLKDPIFNKHPGQSLLARSWRAEITHHCGGSDRIPKKRGNHAN